MFEEAVAVGDPLGADRVAAHLGGHRHEDDPDHTLDSGSSSSAANSSDSLDPLADLVDLDPHPGRAATDDDAFGELFADLDRRRRPSILPGERAGRPLRSWLPAAAAVVAIGATTYFGLSAWWSTTSAGTGLTSPSATTTDPRSADPGPRSPARGSATSPAEGNGAAGGGDEGGPAADRAAPPAAGTSPGSAPIVEHEGRRLSVGQAGDVVASGPWLCDGRELLLLLRPSTGSLHLFPDWPGPGATLDAPVVATVAGGSSLSTEPEDRSSTCAHVVVGRADGTSVRLSPEDLR